jgi:hypothetical protein
MIYQIYKTLRIIFFTLFVCISFYSIKLYEGSIFIYSVYCLSLILMLFYLTDNKASYFEIFFSAYLFLGFWFKYVFSLLLYDGIVYDSHIERIPLKNIDEVLILGILVALICIFSSFIFRNLKKRYSFKNKENLEKSFFVNLYLKNRITVLVIFLILIILLAFFNLNLGIHQRGFLYYHELPSIISNLVKWFLLFGFTTFSCFIFHVEITNLKKINIFTIIIILFEVFSSYTSMLSRSFIINSSSLMLPIYQQSTKLLKKYDFKLMILFIFILFLAVLSIFTANHLRIEKLERVKVEYKELTEKNLDKSLNNGLILEEKLKNYNFQISKNEIENGQSEKNVVKAPIKPTPKELINFMLINRWTGIDSLILVSSSENKGYDVLLRALKEEKNYADYTFYEKEFGLIVRKTNVDTGKTIMKGNTLPGIISFLYYTGSPIFLLLSIIIIFFAFNFLESFLRQMTDNNLVFICFISNMVATRLFHFGYAPKDSYMFLVSILLSVLFLILLMRFKFRFSR